MKIKQGDTVTIISGKDRGKSGTVTRTFADEDRIIVDGINLRTIHRKPTPQKPGARVTEPGKIRASNAMVKCEHCKEKTRIGYRFENGKKVRFCKKCSKTLK